MTEDLPIYTQNKKGRFIIDDSDVIEYPITTPAGRIIFQLMELQHDIDLIIEQVKKLKEEK